jgi:hypothetical protein
VQRKPGCAYTHDQESDVEFFIVMIVLLLGTVAWSIFGMVRMIQWWRDKENWKFNRWDKLWSFHTNIKFLVRFETGKMSGMKALWAFTVALFAFIISILLIVFFVLSWIATVRVP